jgi:serine/threonine protein kinase
MTEIPSWLDRDDLVSGTVVDRYVLVRELGGLMSKTYEALDPEHDRRIVLRILHFGADEATRLRFCREAERLTELSHPNVVQIHDSGTFGEHAWVVMELVRRMTNELDWRHGWRKVLEVMLGVGEGLAAAHRFGILHGDFNPHFYLRIGDDGRARVQGFMCMLLGNAPVAQRDETTGGTVWTLREDPMFGNPSYMGPEYWTQGRIRLTTAADQFAFCTTLWEALHGERPFGGYSASAYFTNVTTGKLRSPPQGVVVPGWLRRACERGLAVDPAARWPSMEALLEALAQGPRAP